MKHLKSFESYNFNNEYNKLKQVIDTDNPLKSLDNFRRSWDGDYYDKIMSLGGCEVNIIVGEILEDKGFDIKTYVGESGDMSLPKHYIIILGDNIIDLVAGQFWGYGLGNNIDDVDKAIFTKGEYFDIYQNYNWTEI